MGANQGLPHQEDREEFSTRSGQIAHEVLSTHGFLMRHNETKEHTFSTGSPKEPEYLHDDATLSGLSISSISTSSILFVIFVGDIFEEYRKFHRLS